MDVVVNDECRVSLVKLPQFVAQAWRKRPPGEIVGVLEEERVNKEEGTNASQATTVPSPGHQDEKLFTLLLSGAYHRGGSVTRLTGRSCHAERMHLISQVGPNLPRNAIVSPFAGSSSMGEDANDEGLTIEASIRETVVLTPVLTDGVYQGLLKARAAAAIRPGREVIEEGITVSDTNNGNQHPRLFQYYHGGTGEEAPANNKRKQQLGTNGVQAKKDQVRMALFDIFESRAAEPLTMTELTRLTRQSQQFLKPLLDECAVAVPAGGDRRRVTYVLRPEFARR